MNITSAAGKKLLRCGYTTGTCAALGAAGAARLLLTGKAPESVGLRTPKGIVVEVAPIYCRKTAAGAQCAIRKDGGGRCGRYHRPASHSRHHPAAGCPPARSRLTAAPVWAV